MKFGFIFSIFIVLVIANCSAELDFDYHHYEQVEKYVKDLANSYDFVEYGSPGKSVKGRELYYVTLSTGTDKPKPWIKYVGNMHGDETVGREVLLHFIDKLVTGYQKDDRITRLLDETNILILPSMNPDGFELGRRTNANRKDLNRNFPDHWHDPEDSKEGREPEVQALMDLIRSKPWMISANLHGGAVVCNYGWDNNQKKLPYLESVDRTNLDGHYGKYSATPDDDVMIEICKKYSFSHENMYKSRSFKDGITNGADWYELRGGMQDYNYAYYGCFEVTLELSKKKYPKSKDLPLYWGENEEALLSYFELSYGGLRGVVVDSETSLPVPSKITIVNRPDSPATSTDQEYAAYFRLLLAGNYQVKATPIDDSYEPLTLDITLPEDAATTPTYLNFELSKK